MIAKKIKYKNVLMTTYNNFYLISLYSVLDASKFVLFNL